MEHRIIANEFMGRLQSAMSLHQAGHLEQAAAIYEQLLQLDPGSIDALHLLGVIAAQRADFGAAVRLFDRALIINPDFAEALSNRGLALMDLNRFEDAVASFDRVLAMVDDVETYNNRGAALQRLNRLGEALASYDCALKLDPGLAEAHCNRGIALRYLNRLDEALASSDRALEIYPGYAEAHNNRAVTLQTLGRIDEALAGFDHALRLRPDYAEAHTNASLCRLLAGSFMDGWLQHEWRWEIDYGRSGLVSTERDFPYPNWTGIDLGGKTLLVWGEQGIGDEILFSGMFSEVIVRAGHCVIECKAKLVPLFACSFPDAEVVPLSMPPHPATLEGVDYQSAAGSLGRWLRPSLESFPRHDGYLRADAGRVSFWKARLATLGPGLKVGISWRSNNLKRDRHLYCTTLDMWGAILTVPGVHFVNLQYGECAAELDAAVKGFGVPLHAFEEVDLFDDLLEAAALTMALDLVISAPTSSSLLAGALGVPTWMMTYGPTWQTHGTDYVPWFPSMRLHARRWDQPWEAVIANIAEHLRSLALAHDGYVGELLR